MRYLLALSAASIFLGRAYQYLFFDAPLRVLLWDEKLMTPLVTGVFGRPWADYATDPAVPAVIYRVQVVIGLLWVVAGVCCLWLLRGYRRGLAVPVIAGALALLVHALLSMKDHFYHLAQFFEFGIQLVTPLLWWLFARGGVGEGRLILAGKIAVAVTFAAHGLYAIGAYPVPGNFVDMSILTLGLSEGGARTYLQVAGLLDLVVAVALFLPRVDRVALGYATVWGLATAAARMIYGYKLDFVESYLHEYFYQTLFRLPHGLLPLLLLIWMRRTTR